MLRLGGQGSISAGGHLAAAVCYPENRVCLWRTWGDLEPKMHTGSPVVGEAVLGGCTPVQPPPSSLQRLCELSPAAPARVLPCSTGSRCRGAAALIAGVSRGAGGKFLSRTTTSGPACSRQPPRPVGQRRLVLPAHAVLGDQLPNPALCPRAEEAPLFLVSRGKGSSWPQLPPTCSFPTQNNRSCCSQHC